MACLILEHFREVSMTLKKFKHFQHTFHHPLPLKPDLIMVHHRLLPLKDFPNLSCVLKMNESLPRPVGNGHRLKKFPQWRPLPLKDDPNIQGALFLGFGHKHYHPIACCALGFLLLLLQHLVQIHFLGQSSSLDTSSCLMKFFLLVFKQWLQ